MAIAQPVSTSPLGSPDHSALHRIIAADTAADVKLIAAYADGTVRIGDTANSDYSEIEADGTYVAHGDATTWDDLRIIPGAFDFAGNADPTIRDWQPGGSGSTFKVFSFNQSDEAFFTCQIPHTYVEGSSIYPHVHWTPHTRGTTEGTATVAWKLDYSWANFSGVFGASATVDMTAACQSTNHQHLLTPEPEVVGTGKTISSMLVCRLYRSTGDTWAGSGVNSPYLLEFDFHFQINTIGSRTVTSK